MLGCHTATEETPAIIPTAPVVPRNAERQVVAVIGDGNTVPISLRFRSVSGLYRKFFSELDLVGPLGTALGACQAEEAVVLITYDSEHWIGTITLETDPKTFACAANLTDEGLDLSPMSPVGAALARYRDQVSGAYDIRVASFKVGVSVLRNTNLCTFWLGGQFPPDGSTWSRCVSFAGVEHCVDGPRDEGVTALKFDDPNDRNYAAACFGY